MRSQPLPRLPMHRSLLLFAALLTLLLVAGVVFFLVLPGMSYSVPVPTVVPGTVKIVTLGDSQTAGYGDERVGIPEAGGYPAMLILPVIKLRPGSRVTNLGQGGWTSSDLVLGKKDVPRTLKPALPLNRQIICVWIATDDVLYFTSQRQE